MGSGASQDSCEDPSTQITGISTGRDSPLLADPRNSVQRRRSSQPVDQIQPRPAQLVAVKSPIRPSTQGRIDAEAITKKKTDQLFAETSEAEDDLLLSAKSSLESDDDAFDKFCGEIDRVLEWQGSDVEATQRRRSSVGTSVLPGDATLAGSGSEGATSQPNKLPHHHAFPGLGKQQDPLFHHLAHIEQQHLPNALHFHPTRLIESSGPPSLAAKRLEKPISVWKRPEELVHQEQALRDQYRDSLPQCTKSADASRRTSLSRGASQDGPMMRRRQSTDDRLSQAERKEMKWEEPELQLPEKEGFDISKFKAANKKKNSQMIEKLLPATYKGYNVSLSGQGTLPSLHRGSISSTASSSSTPASDKNRVSSIDDSKALKYNPSEEALLDYIEKELS